MTSFSHGPISQLHTTSPRLYAFVVSGHIDDDASEALAKYMNGVFDKHSEKVDMLLDLSGFSGSDWDSILDVDVIASRLRALTNVDKYAVVGAPDSAARMIALMDKIIPVKARAFDKTEMEAAWAWLGEKRPST